MSRRTAVVTLICLALAGFSVFQWRQVAAQQADILSLRAQLAEKSRELEEARAREQRSSKQRSQLRQRLSSSNPRPQPAKPAPVKSPDEIETDNMARLLAKSMNDPELKKQAHERAVHKVGELYGDLIVRLNLSPAETTNFTKLAAENERKISNKMMTFLADDGTTNWTGLVELLGAAQNEGDQSMRALLGDAHFAEFQDYRKTVGERDALHQFEDTPGNELTQEQRNQMLAILKEERQQLTATTGLPLAGLHSTDASTTDWAEQQAVVQKNRGYSEDDLASMVTQTEQILSQRIYERAKAILRPEQLTAFGEFQARQLSETAP